jgi:hypothetical protein
MCDLEELPDSMFLLVEGLARSGNRGNAFRDATEARSLPAPLGFSTAPTRAEGVAQSLKQS